MTDAREISAKFRTNFLTLLPSIFWISCSSSLTSSTESRGFKIKTKHAKFLPKETAFRICWYKNRTNILFQSNKQRKFHFHGSSYILKVTREKRMKKFHYSRNSIPLLYIAPTFSQESNREQRASNETNLVVERAAGLDEGIGVEFVRLEETETLLEFHPVFIRRRRASSPSRLRRSH
jgi:hypothetical protein